MSCSRAVVATVVAMSLGSAAPAAAQAWNDARTMSVVQRATERRSRQLADTGLASWTATALGSLTFLAQVGEGFPDPPKVVKADQIALEVYWRAPNSSKQLILGRRDTLLLPTDIQYHRDHLGIVQNNFPDIIRLGEGDEVRDVPHPLSLPGHAVYDYAISDSLRIGIPGRVIDVVEVRLRPKDDTRAAAVGAVYLAQSDAQVVRMAFSFTAAALIDPQLEDVAIVLDNALIEERFWLPRRQEIEIRRRGTWLDFPTRGIIRGGWDICCYRINEIPPLTSFIGPEIQLAPPERRAAFQFEGPTSVLVPPGLATVTGEDIARVQAQARELMQERALAPARGPGLQAGAISELFRITRAEGVSLGAGLALPIAGRWRVTGRARYGLSDHRFQGVARLTWPLTREVTLQLSAYNDVRDASDFPEASGLRNSLGAQEFGADHTEPFRARGAELRVEWRGAMPPAVRMSWSIARDHADSTPVSALPARGRARPTPSVLSEASWHTRLGFALSPRAWLSGRIDGRLDYMLRLRPLPGADQRVGRLVTELQYQRDVAAGRLVVQARGGITNSSLTQDQIRLGGPVTGPGYPIHSFTGSALLSHRVEWQFPVAFPSVPLGRWGRTPGEARVAPFGSVVLTRSGPPNDRSLRGYPSAGISLITFFDLLRLDLSRGLRGGRWRFGIDVSRDLWPVL